MTLIPGLSRLLLIVCTLMLAAPLVHAHSMSPTLLQIVESEAGHYQLTIRQPNKLANKQVLDPQFPEHCRRTGDARESRFTLYSRLDFALDCGEIGLAGQRISVPSLQTDGIPVVLRFRHLSGATVTAMLNADNSAVIIQGEPEQWEVFVDYFRLGGEHLLGGLDHLLFLAALVLLVQHVRPLVAVVTAFTLGHAASVVVVTLGLLHIVSAWVEVFIALSIVVLALDVFLREVQLRPVVYTALLCAVFGVLHGMGFASALNIDELGRWDRALALLGFNLGIEAVQLLVVSGSAVVLFLLFQLAEMPQRYLLKPAALMLGTTGAFWFWERLLLSLSQVQ